MIKHGIRNVKIVRENEILQDHCIIYSDVILDIIPKANIQWDASIIWKDGGGSYLAPGFIDIHIHGAGGSDTMDGTLEAFENIGKTIVKYGTTSFLPTTVTLDIESTVKALDKLNLAMQSPGSGARIQGVHLEGPFINRLFKGAHEEAYILHDIDKRLEPYLSNIKLVTLAPEIENGEAILQYFKQLGAAVSIGHTNATYDQTKSFIENGVSHVTHVFNAMRPLHHREPGVLGAVLTSNITRECCQQLPHK